MIFEREIGEKGQVVIPIDIRNMLKLKARAKVNFEVRNNEVILKPVEEDSEEFLKEFFSLPKLKKRMSPKEMKDLILSENDEKFSKIHRL